MATSSFDGCPTHSSNETNGLHRVSPSSTDRSPFKSWPNVPSVFSSQHLLESPFEYDNMEMQSKKQTRNNKTRTINHITLGFIAYFAVAAGPFGVENAVRAAGAYPVLLAVVVLPFTWGLPQALMVSERHGVVDFGDGVL